MSAASLATAYSSSDTAPRERDAGTAKAFVRLEIAQRSETVVALPDAWASLGRRSTDALARLFGEGVETLA